MTQVNCVRCGKTGGQLGQPPLPTDLGNRIFDSICQECWGEWLKQQTTIINHYGLNLVDPEARKFLTQQTELFLYGPPDG